MRATYRVVAVLIALMVVVQAAAVAFGTFGFINEVDSGAVVDENSELPNFGPILHSIGGTAIIPLLSLVLLVVSFFTKVPGSVKWALLVLLAVAVQITLAFVAFGAPVVGLLHGLNAFVLLGLALTAAWRARPVATTEPAQQTAVAGV